MRFLALAVSLGASLLGQTPPQPGAPEKPDLPAAQAQLAQSDAAKTKAIEQLEQQRIALTAAKKKLIEQLEKQRITLAAPNAIVRFRGAGVCSIPLTNVTPKNASEMDKPIFITPFLPGGHSIQQIRPPAPSCDDATAKDGQPESGALHKIVIERK